MTDEIKFLLQTMEWPEPDKNLASRIMAAAGMPAPSPFWFVARPWARYTFGAGLALCMAAGYLLAPQLVDVQALATSPQLQSWLVAGADTAYIFSY